MRGEIFRLRFAIQRYSRLCSLTMRYPKEDPPSAFRVSESGSGRDFYFISEIWKSSGVDDTYPPYAK